MRSSNLSILLIGVLLAACGGGSGEPPARIVLMTLPGVGVDEVDELASLSRLGQEADWVGRGIAASSYIVPAAASLFTGLSPWNHQVIHAGQPNLREDLYTLAEALTERGYRGVGFSSDPWTSRKMNYDQGFESFETFSAEITPRLEKRARRKEFFWIQPRTQYRTLPRKETLPIPMAELEASIDSLLTALQSSPSWSETLLVVTAEHGPRSSDLDRPLMALERDTLEVPLIIRLPEKSNRTLSVDPGQPVAIQRVWATLVESAGGRTLPAAATSLYRNGEGAILSELYRVQGANHYSLVEGDLQWLSRVPFQPESSPRGRVRRQANLFAATRPFSGYGQQRTVLLRWQADGSTTELFDDALSSRLEETLERRRAAFVDLERTPAAEFALRSGRQSRATAGPRSQTRSKQPLDH